MLFHYLTGGQVNATSLFLHTYGLSIGPGLQGVFLTA